MGGLGYTEEQALDQYMPAIERAYSSRVKILGALIGGGELPAPRTDVPPKRRSVAAEIGALASKKPAHG